MLEARWNQLAVLVLSTLFVLASCGNGLGNGESAGVSASVDSGDDAPEPSNEFYLGERRDDLERFFGLYGEPGRGQFFVTSAKRPKHAEKAPEIPPGYLAIGAMWGDIAPMNMKSLSETKFEQVDLGDFAPDTPNVAEFELGPDGNPVALAFTSGSFSEFGRRVRIGDLPEKWR